MGILFEQAETEYNRNYDPYEERCPLCGAVDRFETVPLFEGDEEVGEKTFCTFCHYEVE